MISNSTAFKKLKLEQQRILDFAVLICHSIPNAKKTIAGEDKGINHFSFPTPDYFTKVSNSRLSSISKNYKSNLAKYLIISGYSFFESYFKDVIKELIEFHGGKEKVISATLNKSKSRISNIEEDKIKIKRKLQEYPKSKKSQKYAKYLNLLENDYSLRTPSELFSVWGIRNLINLCTSENFRSSQIPEIMEYGFLMDLSSKGNKTTDLKELDLKQTFHSMRNVRNLVSHGGSPSVELPKTMDYLRFLRRLAVKFDKHLVENFFIIEFQ